MSLIETLYLSFRKRLPREYQGLLSRLVFCLPWVPLTRKDKVNRILKFPGGESGGVIISADFELAWAYRYSKKNNNYEILCERERNNIPIILNLFNKYNISITWATVGHLMLKQCSKNEHDWMKRIPHFDNPWDYTSGDWFDHDPHSNWIDSPYWYAPDIIDKIFNAEIKHEIGCHTFSHIDCSDKNCPSEVLNDELSACSAIARQYNIDLYSFVFPGGTFGNFKVLRSQGYKIYRTDSKYKLSYPNRDKYGLLSTTSSYAFGEKGLGYTKEYSIYKFRKYINKAISSGTIAHFWFHPSMDSFTLEYVFPEVLKYAARKRDENKLWIGTMKEIAMHINDKNLLQTK
jgi:peptidoglycan/xylan/chitin deacetylase (PgdA/CDA1 family)